MIKLADGRGSLFQWDTGRQVECDAEQVHFSNHHYGTSIDVDVRDGKATIPNQLLTSATPLKAWAWAKDSSGEYTKEEQIFIVEKRNKPSDYVYTPTEIKTWQDLQNQIGDLNNLKTTHKDNLVNAINDAAGSGGGGSVDSVNGKTGAVVLTAEDINYDNDNTVYQLMSQWSVDLETVGKALTTLDEKSHTHANKDTLDKLSDSNGKLQYNGSDVGLKPAYYIDLAGNYLNYTCPVAMDDIKAAYNSGYNLVCRCKMGAYTATLPLFVPMPAANTWLFSGSGALKSMGFDAQSFTVAIMSNGVVVQQTLLNMPLNITAGGKIYTYDGSNAVSVAVKTEAYSVTTTDGSVALADNTEYRLTNLSTLTITYPPTNFECWLRLSFATSGTITVTLPTDTKYLGATPNFKNGETWELSFKDRVMVAQKVGDGSMAPIETVEDGTEVSY